MNEYAVLMAYSPKDGAYVTAVPALPGCMSDGKTVREALDNTDGIVEEWLADARESGGPVPEPDGRTLTLVATLDELFERMERTETK